MSDDEDEKEEETDSSLCSSVASQAPSSLEMKQRSRQTYIDLLVIRGVACLSLVGGPVVGSSPFLLFSCHSLIDRLQLKPTYQGGLLNQICYNKY